MAPLSSSVPIGRPAACEAFFIEGITYPYFRPRLGKHLSKQSICAFTFGVGSAYGTPTITTEFILSPGKFTPSDVRPPCAPRNIAPPWREHALDSSTMFSLSLELIPLCSQSTGFGSSFSISFALEVLRTKKTL